VFVFVCVCVCVCVLVHVWVSVCVCASMYVLKVVKASLVHLGVKAAGEVAHICAAQQYQYQLPSSVQGRPTHPAHLAHALSTHEHPAPRAQKFWVLETVARIPYFACISILHLYESLGFWRAGAELRKIHFFEE